MFILLNKSSFLTQFVNLFYFVHGMEWSNSLKVDSTHTKSATYKQSQVKNL